MPHQCTNCERVFPDGSKEMLSGCPDCGGNKFQFRPDSGIDAGMPGADDAPSDPPSGSGSSDPTPDSSPVADPDRDAERGTDPSSSSPASTPSGSTFIEAESDPTAIDADGEDVAQADARRDVVTSNELDRAATPPDAAEDADRAATSDSDESSVTAESPAANESPDIESSVADESPDIDDLRRELNDQFESIKILEPGQYELNLMELYDRQECIISLQEDGHYVIEVADAWCDGD